MSSLLLAAQSGWGKSFHAQAWMETNVADADTYAALTVLDYCGEYRGLVKAGYAAHWIVGPRELHFSVDDWRAILDENPMLVLERHHQVTTDEWRQVCTKIAAASRTLRRDELVVVDEAHFVAPQQVKLPEPIKEIATTGRGEGTSSMWVTQRLAEIDLTVSTQCQERILGGFRGGDLGAVDVEYPDNLHNPAANVPASTLTDELLPSDRETPTTLQKHTDEDGHTIGSEWIYSNNDGEIRRINTQHVNMESTHYGSQGNHLQMPEYSA
ncbi:ATP-binding protein [Haloarcula marina]|uniref:ATP-binding protein n=1 Tax=Haloarcula marina TaxID=2961574 RepID=UPI0020B6D473|nr:ATP-binding protein [Halomicroarcula marina]